MKSVYLAGPDVFLPEAGQHAQGQKALCRRHGFEPLHPFDQGTLSSPGIFRTNIGMIRDAQAVLANLNPFRGPEVDSGTAFEIGFAAALGKTVIGYVSRPDNVMQRVERLHGEIRYDAQADLWRDRDGNLVEDFGHAVNLMLAESCASIVVGNLEDALVRLGECRAAAGNGALELLR
ncbi:MAG: nucleoside 2-deoxyribosyltransferase [Propionivibrio sp.]